MLTGRSSEARRSVAAISTRVACVLHGPISAADAADVIASRRNGSRAFMRRSVVSLHGFSGGEVGTGSMGCGDVAPPSLSSSAKAGDPVRRGLSIQSSASLGYWVPAYAGTTPDM